MSDTGLIVLLLAIVIVLTGVSRRLEAANAEHREGDECGRGMEARGAAVDEREATRAPRADYRSDLLSSTASARSMRSILRCAWRTVPTVAGDDDIAFVTRDADQARAARARGFAGR